MPEDGFIGISGLSCGQCMRTTGNVLLYEEIPQNGVGKMDVMSLSKRGGERKVERLSDHGLYG